MPESTRCQLDSPLKNRIIGAKLTGKKTAEVARLFELPYSTTRDVWNRFCSRGTTHNAPRSGRPKIATPRLSRRIIREVRKNRRLPLYEIAKQVSPRLATRTIRRILAENGYHRRRARRVPYLTLDHRKQRLVWAKALRAWGEFEFGRIIFSDECYVHVSGSPGTVYVSRRADEADIEECFAPSIQQSPVKVMVWGCIMLGCRGPLEVLDFPGGRGGGMNSERYQEVLERSFLHFYRQRCSELRAAHFQQDNARCHTSKSTQLWLQRNGVQIFPHPPSSPDLNPIENIWKELKRRIRAHQHIPTSVAELKQAIFLEWERLSASDINNYVLSMPHRVRAVIAANGGNTKY